VEIALSDPEIGSDFRDLLAKILAAKDGSNR
jgi:hypothetical protein